LLDLFFNGRHNNVLYILENSIMIKDKEDWRTKSRGARVSLDEVREAIQHLINEDIKPSLRAIQERIGHGSLETIGKLKQQVLSNIENKQTSIEYNLDDNTTQVDNTFKNRLASIENYLKNVECRLENVERTPIENNSLARLGDSPSLLSQSSDSESLSELRDLWLEAVQLWQEDIESYQRLYEREKDDLIYQHEHLNEQLQAERYNLEEQVRELEDQNAALEARLKEREGELLGQVKNYQEHADRATARLNQLEAEHEAQITQISQLSARVTELEGENEEHLESVRIQKERGDSHAEQTKLLEKENQALKEHIKTTQAEAESPKPQPISTHINKSKEIVSTTQAKKRFFELKKEYPDDSYSQLSERLADEGFKNRNGNPFNKGSFSKWVNS